MAIWTLAYRKIKGKPFSFYGHSYLLDIYQDKHPFICSQKSTQCGLSELLINTAFYLADKKSFNSMIIFPADAVLYDFIRGRVSPAINESPHIKSRIADTDNVGIKSMGKAFMYFRGSQTESKLKSVDADCMLYDEVDELAEGTLSLGEKRLGHSSLKWQRAISTPTYPGDGINALFETSDQRHWFIKCHHCNERQPLTFHDNLDIKTATVVCKKCRRPIDRLQRGEWVPKITANTNVRGYQINRLFCERTDLNGLIINSQKTTEYEIKEFYNSDLGLPYAPKGSRLNKTILRACIDGGYEAPCEEAGCVMGVDVGSMLNVVIRKQQEGSYNKAVYIGTIKDFEELDELIKRFDVEVCVIDANPETRKAKELQERHMGIVYLAYYWPRDDKRQELIEIQKDEDDGVDVVKVNRTQAGDHVSNGFTKKTLILPSNIESIPNYFAQVMAPIRVIEKDKSGNEVATYQEFGKPDHYFHSEIYAFIALKISLEYNIIIYEGGENAGEDRDIPEEEDTRSSANKDW